MARRGLNIHGVHKGLAGAIARWDCGMNPCLAAKPEAHMTHSLWQTFSEAVRTTFC